MNPYEMLGIAVASSEEEIKEAHRELSKKYHPDNQETGDEHKFIQIQQAYELLIDKDRRRKYDTTGVWEQGTPKDMRSKIISNISGLLDAVVKNRGFDLSSSDIFKWMVDSIRNEQKRVRGEISNIDIFKRRYEIVSNKIETEETFLKFFIEERVLMYNRQIEHLNSRLEEGDETIKVISKFKYRIFDVLGDLEEEAVKEYKRIVYPEQHYKKKECPDEELDEDGFRESSGPI